MYRYEFERIETSLCGWGPFAGNDYMTDDFKSIILHRANDGWRYVGYIPVSQRGTGHVAEMDLVFEKEV